MQIPDRTRRRLVRRQSPPPPPSPGLLWARASRSDPPIRLICRGRRAARVMR